MLADDTEIASLWLRAKPSVGEYIWLTGNAGEAARAEHGTSSFTVQEVAHWVNAAWSPGTHTGDPIHTLAVYVEPTQCPESVANE
ncbi:MULTISPECIES: hypothetical protein [unclassified Sphingopyxis]|uniref:hypothetical protein n=1 Tax=unclassified Sphingopyxis TaxID=2614943 RepID=UPI00285B9E26|nr:MULTISPECIES: hypothetical protein [unclassified Sphingopyxis]MDR7061209.1 hypothetical protein [Sphingopyxis sp. BE235]MDR7182060.1 hypothetical protein [Sphingopyxis sp. BE249]